MGLIDTIEPLTTILSSAVNKSQQHQETNSWECSESNRGLLGAKKECYPLCYAPPPPPRLELWSPRLNKFSHAVSQIAKAINIFA